MRDKKITNCAALTLIAYNVGLFSWIWLNYYNRFAFRSHRFEGAIGAIVVFYILYRWLSKLYRAYSIASTSIGETVLSQFISFSLADLFLYVASCLLRRNYVNILPGAAVVVLQLLGSTLIIWCAKRYLMAHIRPAETLLIYGGKETAQTAEQFVHRLSKKYSHLFHVGCIMNEMQDEAEIFSKIESSENIILQGVTSTRRVRFMEKCLDEEKVFFFAPDFEDILCRNCSVKNFLDTPLMRYDYSYKSNRNYFIKRIFDIVLALFFIVVLSPIMLLVALCIKLEDGGPVFFRQERVTQNGKTFNILKFRSMVVDAEKYGAVPATEKDPRITRIGQVIRNTRIDETPQFFNVLMGQMSFVGPRPERTLHVELYEKEVPEFKYRLRVKGGLTGYAQVYGKYNTSPEDKMKLDMLYIENQSFLLDFKLILLTIKTMFQSESTEGFDEKKSAEIHNVDRQKKAN